MSRQINRRKLLGNAAAATSLAAIAQPFGISSALADYAVAPAKRRAASGLTASNPIIVGYARAVKAMKALPDTDPCSWKAQAAIHWPGFPTASPLAGPCQHGNLFWAWHRMYLYWFERIVRHKSGMYDWALPYWDYDWETVQSSYAQRQIPLPFRISTSALYDPLRAQPLNLGTAALSPNFTLTANGFIPTSYMSAQSSFNGTPHGAVHVSVGGDMGQFSTAGLDPLFWIHHCAIDRLWNLWLAKGGGRSAPLNDAAWKNTSFTFYDECCQPVKMTACDVLRCAEQLSYVYEVEPPQVNQYCPPIKYDYPWATKVLEVMVLERPLILDGSTRTVPLAGRDSKEMVGRLTSLAKSDTETPLLKLNGVEADRQPGAAWEVYVGLPANAKASAESPHFVGNVAMFGDGIKEESHHPAEFTFPLTRALRASADMSALQVTFVPTSGIVYEGGRPLPAEVRAPVRIGEVSLAVDRATRQQE